jgi:hypothetical protein
MSCGFVSPNESHKGPPSLARGREFPFDDQPWTTTLEGMSAPDLVTSQRPAKAVTSTEPIRRVEHAMRHQEITSSSI